MCACCCNCITAVKLCRGISLVNKDHIGRDYTELWLLRLTALQTGYNQNHSTQPAPLNSSLSDPEKCNVKCHYDCTTVLSNSVGMLICYANGWCLMHNQFSVTQMLGWQQIGCYRIALSELKYHCMNELHMRGANAE